MDNFKTQWMNEKTRFRLDLSVAKEWDINWYIEFEEQRQRYKWMRGGRDEPRDLLS